MAVTVITLVWATLGVIVQLHFSPVESRTAAASSFPGVRPSRPARSHIAAHCQDWWNDGGPGGASSDDEGEEEDDDDDDEEEESSDDEEWNRLSMAVAASDTTANHKRSGNKMDEVILASTNGGGQGANYGRHHTTSPPSPAAALAPQQNTTRGSAGRVASSPSSSSSSSSSSSASQPMQTLNKLQQMLDDTDYITSNSDRAMSSDNNNISNNNNNSNHRKEPHRKQEQAQQGPGASPDKLWTSKDRSKYKRAQNRVGGRSQQPNRAQSPVDSSSAKQHAQRKRENPLQQQSSSHMVQPLHQAPQEKPTVRPSPPLQFSSDDDNSEAEDGLGYTLPNLPVYYSDGEEESDDERQPSKPANNNNDNAMVSGFQQPPVPPLQQQGASPYGAFPPPPQHYGYPQQQQLQQQQQQQQPPPLQYGTGGNSPQPYPYSAYYQYPYAPQYMTPMQQQAYYSQQYGPWIGQQPLSRQAPLQLPPKPSLTPSPQQRQLASTQQTLRPASIGSTNGGGALSQSSAQSSPSAGAEASRSVDDGGVAVNPGRLYVPGYTPVTIFVPPENLADQSQTINFDSFQKFGLVVLTVTLGSYAAVSPRTLPLSEYNLRFYENLGLVALATISPIIQCLLVVAPSENDINAFINTFFTSFSVGFVWAFISEIIATTVVRLLIFSWFEPSIFSLAPKVPIPVIPWVLRETGYRPKRITLLASEIAASCLVCPIIEEYIKLCILRWTTPLKRNFNWTKKQIISKSSEGNRKRKMRNVWATEPIIRPPNESDIVNANQYVAQMLAASLGLKFADAGRRILLYTKQEHPSKQLYAFFRGLFPLQELTGTMTALQLAKRNLLGLEMPMWKLLLPAVVIHGMANFRGKKPIYRWGSATPWAEMQLPAFHVPDSSSLPKLLTKGFAKIMWFIIITRVIGYCVKNYYMVNRQAVKRTTTFAGRPASFSAKLTTSEALKKK